MRSILPIQVATTLLAIEADRVVEVLGTQPWVALPGARPEVPGILSWRGRALPVVDLRVLGKLGSPLGAEGSVRTLVVRAGGTTFAVPVEAVREVRPIPGDSFRVAEVTRVPFATREIDLDGTPVPCLDLEAAVGRLGEAK